MTRTGKEVVTQPPTPGTLPPVDFTQRHDTGSALLTFENAVDIGVFDGRIGPGTVESPTPLPAVDERSTGAPPPDPKNTGRRWNPWALTLGVAMVLAGLSFIGFAAFQKFGTDAIAASHQADLEAEFEVRKEGPVPVTTETPPVTSSADPAEFDDPEDVPVLIGPTGDPLLAESDNITLEAPPASGMALGRIVIPQAGVDWVVVEGVSAADLRKGPGHMPGTAVPGQPGNAVISGHRTTYGSPFNRLDLLVPGDRFTVETLIGDHTYEVVSTLIVAPTGVWVTEQWTGGWLTLTTCNPKGSSRERLIVFSKLVDGPNAAAIRVEYPSLYQPPQPPA